MGMTQYANNFYSVSLRPGITAEGWVCPMTELSVKRQDRAAVHDWRDLQRIKNELVGPEHEAFEIYPAESRLVDTANQYYLWVFEDPEVRIPFGFTQRDVAGPKRVRATGGDQRPFRNKR
jgi:hypothetical protein